MRKKLFRQMNRRRPEKDQLQVEHLESRMLLSGNVLASVVNGTLTIIGDGDDNAVQVSTFHDSDYGLGFKVQGHDNYGPTTVNGYDCEEFFYVTNLSVELNGGDDDFALTNDLDELLCCLEDEHDSEVEANTFIEEEEFKVPGWVVIKMGDGKNRVGVGAGEICGRLLVQGGSGCDQVGICETKVGGSIVIQTFGGDDKVAIHESKSYGVTRVLTANGCSEVEIEEFCAANLVVRGGNHKDNVFIACVSIDDDLVVQTLGGKDCVEIVECCEREDESPEPSFTSEEEDCCCEYVNYVGDMLLVQTGDGDSFVEIASVSAGQMNILGGIDDDEIELECVETYWDIRITTLDGCDIVDIVDLNVRSLIISTGLGSDEVYVGREECANFFAEDLIVRTDGGDDVVIVGQENFGIEANFEENGREQSHIGDDLIIETGNDTDYIKVFDYCIGNDAVINAGAGDDSSFEYDGPSETFNGDNNQGGVDLCELKIGSNLTVLLGDGADSASIDDVCVEGNATVDAGAGDDGGGNNDRDDVDAFNGGGSSNAGVWIEDLFVKNNFWLILGTGHDEASLSDVEICGNAYLHGGLDCDEIGLNYLDVGQNLFVFMGGGDDELFIDNSSAEVARLFGDGGYDVYYEGSNSFGSQYIYTFEALVA